LVSGSPEAVRTRLWSVAEYHRLVEAGVIPEDDRVELLEGVIVEVSPQSERHARAIQYLTALLVKTAGEGFVVRPRLPLTLSDSEPEPDLAVVRLEDAASLDEHPSRAFLVIETASTTLAHDRTVKGRVYARGGIPEYWIVNLPGRTLEVHRDPDPAAGRYRVVSTLAPGETARCSTNPGLVVEVAALFR
jgi:Uma2 family endonuclease